MHGLIGGCLNGLTGSHVRSTSGATDDAILLNGVALASVDSGSPEEDGARFSNGLTSDAQRSS